ncbi:hypothetical protein [Seohaeicola saemankumensis]|nr:hypothetical protein [Seohaeicola saemankumensis]
MKAMREKVDFGAIRMSKFYQTIKKEHENGMPSQNCFEIVAGRLG